MRRTDCLPTLVFMILLSPIVLLAACTGAGGIRSEVVTAENSSQLADQIKKELTYEEVDLLNGYVERLFPDLPEGELPSGRTIGEMIEAQREFLSQSAQGEDRPQVESGAGDSAPAQATRTGDESSSPKQTTSNATSTAEPSEPLAPSPPPAPTAVEVPSGTSIQVRLAQPLSSKTNQSGQTFETTLENDLVVDGQLVAPEGSRLMGTVVDAKASGKVKGRAQMSITLSQLLVDSDSYDLDTGTLSFEADSTAKKDAGRIGIGAGAGAIIGAIAGGGKGAAIGTAIGAGAGTGVTLATSGKEVEFPVEQLFEFRLEKSVEMNIIR
ncbi:MAG TPA: hypothetical protein VMY18_01450 [Acidobacteriota bacterium]|nr:hypothetical protein [Acidobacteriota bacterium]